MKTLFLSNDLNAELSMKGSEPFNKYKFNGKEFQKDLNLEVEDFGARFYDPVVPHWWQVDPLEEKYRRWAPYNFGVDNPVRFIDPDGMGIEDNNGKQGTQDPKTGQQTTAQSTLYVPQVKPIEVKKIEPVNPEISPGVIKEISTANSPNVDNQCMDMANSGVMKGIAGSLVVGMASAVAGDLVVASLSEVLPTASRAILQAKNIIGKVGSFATTEAGEYTFSAITGAAIHVANGGPNTMISTPADVVEGLVHMGPELLNEIQHFVGEQH